MLILKRLVIAVVALSLLVSAIGGLAPSSAQGLKPAQEVSVVNTPTVQAQQAGPWTVGAQLAPGSTVGISGTPTVSISGTPTVNVASLPALPLVVRPAMPASPRVWEVSLTDAQGEARFEGGPDVRAIGLTSVTLTNFAGLNVQVNMLPPWGKPAPQPVFLVDSQSTLHLAYPTPLVFPCQTGLQCLGVMRFTVLNGGSVRVTLNGFAEY